MKPENPDTPPFSPGEKVRCIKNDAWHLNARRGDSAASDSPVYGGVYTVDFVGKPVSDDPADDKNGVVWSMTLEEFPDDLDWDYAKEGRQYIFSCRRFVKEVRNAS